MNYYPKPGQGFGAPGQPSTKVVSFAAPAQGINVVDPMATLPTNFCTASTNLMHHGRGAEVRYGSQGWVENLGNECRTIIPFKASVTSGDRLFAVTEDGIYDISAGGTGPWSPSEAFGSTGGLAGWGTWTNFVSDAGAHYAFLADEDNGLYRMQESGSWAPVTDITGVSETALVFVTQYKSRIWLVEKNSGSAWYLAAGAISGSATEFNFGNKFAHGGTLVGLWNWTVDGGDGVDDYLVAISSSGDVSIYRFQDPDDVSSFEMTSQYYLGQLPVGRRIAAASGGELFIMCQYGLLPLTGLVSGRPVQDADIVATRNITPLVNSNFALTQNQRGWEIKPCPYQNALILATPKLTGYPYMQFSMSTQSRGWGVFNGLEYITGDTYNGNFFFGGEDGVRVLTGYQDSLAIDGTGGTDISWNLLTAFSDVGEVGRYHRIQFIRPVIMSAGGVQYDAQARYDYNIGEFVATPSGGTVGSLWDVALWDGALWGTTASTYDRVIGGSGIGRAIGLAIAGTANTSTALLRADVLFDTGGPL